MNTDSKPFWASKTLWVNLLAPVVAWAGAKYGFAADAATQAQVVAAVLVVANIALRFVTSQPITIS